VTHKDAYLFTDGRYFLQAEKQLDKLASIDSLISNSLTSCQELDFDEARPSGCADVARILEQGEILDFVNRFL
jgi:hypothetical protein